MAIKRTIGIETEYGITGGSADQVLNSYQGPKKTQYNASKTNESAVKGLHDLGGHDGGDYETIEEQLGKKKTRKISKAYQHTGDIIANGSRFYVDMGHPEYSTAEASNPQELVLLDKVGERIVELSAKKASSKIKIYKDNSDGKGNSYGCHENYLIQRMPSEQFEKELTTALVPFFITRQIFTGSGKINIESESKYGYNYFGRSIAFQNKSTESAELQSYEKQLESMLSEVHSLSKHFLDMSDDYKALESVLKSLDSKRRNRGVQQIFQLSQRADFFSELIGLQTTNNRPLVNTRDEPHADDKYMRLHVINGDANMCETATYLKVGTASLVLDMFEDGLLPSFDVASPVKQFQSLSSDQSRKWLVDLSNGKNISAIDIQRAYLEVAKETYSGRDHITDDVLSKWDFTLSSLEKDPMLLFGKVDWVTKLGLLTRLCDSKGLKLTDTPIKNAALQYHHVDRDSGLFYVMQKKGAIERIVSDEEIDNSLFTPPSTTRAYLRGKATDLPSVSKVDWGEFKIKAGKSTYVVSLDEPLSGTKEQVEKILALKNPKHVVEELEKVEGITCKKKTFIPSFKRSKKSNYAQNFDLIYGNRSLDDFLYPDRF